MSTINLSVPPTNPLPELRPRISVIGVGGAGGNAVNNMIRARLEGVEFLAANTDSQALAQSLADRQIQLGVTVTQGLGAGSRPDIGRIAAEEALEDIIEEFRGSNMVFIAAGMGGGTGTGAAPVIARAAREQGILTVGVVTKPFHFEGAHRMRLADQGIEDLEQYVDTLIIIPNQNLFRVANERTTFADAFKMADDVLYSGVRGVTDLMVMPGLINLDFADIRAVMSEMGKAMMGTGEATGDRRALDAAEAAISNPLLDDVSMKGARGVLINITGGSDMTLFEVDEAANRIRSEVDTDAFIIFGSTFDDTLDGRIRVSVVATGMDAISAKQPITKLNVTNINDVRQQARGRGGAASDSLHIPAAAEATGMPMEALREGTRDSVVQDATASSPHAVSATIEDGKFMPPVPLSKSGDLAAAASAARPIESEAHRTKPGMVSSLLSGMFGNSRTHPARGDGEAAPEEPKAAQPKPSAAAPAGDRPPTAQSEEEYFDIPAFLRRQAN